MEAGNMIAGFKRLEPSKGSLTDGDQPIRLLHLAQQMGTPLNVVHGRMEYLLDQKLDRETRRSLTAILTQAKQLIDLRQQLLDQIRQGGERAAPELPNNITGPN